MRCLPIPSLPELPSPKTFAMTPLTHEQESVVTSALGAGNKHEILINYKNIPIDRQHMRSLRPGRLINDEIINYFRLLIESRTTPKIYTFGTDFYIKLTTDSNDRQIEEIQYDRVKRYTKKVDIFDGSHNFIMIPIHHREGVGHWSLVIVNFNQCQLEYYDSLCGNGNTFLENVLNYMQHEFKNKKNIDIDIMSQWKLVVLNGPEQRKSLDCGVFMLRAMDCISRGMPLATNTFYQEDMNYHRRRMVYEIMTSALFQ